MGSWVWVFVPVVAILAGVAKRWFSLKEKQIEMMQRDAAEKQARYAAMTERLEQRVRVLERIATDKGIDVSDEIERLRDSR